MRTLPSLLLALALTGTATAQTPRTLTPVRDLVIYGDAQDLAPITHLRVAGDGTIAALSYHDMVVRFFTADGRDAGRFGRRGEGPGEFEQPAFLGWRGTTFWVYDPTTQRLTWIGPDRTLARSERVAAEMLPPAGHRDQRRIAGPPVVMAVTANGDRVMNYETQATTIPGWLPIAAGDVVASIVRTDSTGRFQRALRTADHRALRERAPECAVPRMMVSLCDPQVENHPTALGTTVVDAAPTRRDRQFRLLFIDAVAGDTTIDRLVPYRALPIPTRYADSINAVLARQDRSVTPWKFPATIRPVQETLTGLDGTVWLRVDPPWEPSQQWRVFDRRGTEIGQVTLPARVALRQASRAHAWGIQRDENDLERIVRYRLR